MFYVMSYNPGISNKSLIFYGLLAATTTQSKSFSG